MHYYNFNIGDFRALSDGLDDEALGILVRLMNRYVSSENPIKTEWVSLAFPSKTQEKALAVLHALWEETEEGFVLPSLSKIISDYKAMTIRNHENGKKGGRPKKPHSETQTKPSGFLMGNQDGNQVGCESVQSGNPNETLTNKPINQEIKESKKKSSAVHRFALTAIPSSWLDYAKSARPDLDPEREFQNFRFYFTEGKGSAESRSDRGWNQSWQGWVKRAKETPKPEEKPSIFAVPKEQQLQMLKDAGKYQKPFLRVPDDSDYQTLDISAFKGEQR